MLRELPKEKKKRSHTTSLFRVRGLFKEVPALFYVSWATERCSAPLDNTGIHLPGGFPWTRGWGLSFELRPFCYLLKGSYIQQNEGFVLSTF